MAPKKVWGIRERQGVDREIQDKNELGPQDDSSESGKNAPQNRWNKKERTQNKQISKRSNGDGHIKNILHSKKTNSVQLLIRGNAEHTGQGATACTGLAALAAMNCFAQTCKDSYYQEDPVS